MHNRRRALIRMSAAAAGIAADRPLYLSALDALARSGMIVPVTDQEQQT